MLRDDIRALPEFSKAIYTSLAHEAFTDPELFVLLSSGVLLASRSRILKGVGIALGGWFISRRVDHHMMMVASKVTLLAQVISESNTQEANEQ